MKRRTASYAGLALIAFAGALYALHVPLAIFAAQNGAKAEAPIFEVDPYWPKPLPNHWVLGSTIGLSVDAQDHVWIVHRPGTVEDNFKAADFNPPIGVCCKVAPDVLHFDANGATWSAAGAERAPATNGRRATTASPSIRRAASGLAATAIPTRRF